MLLPVPLLRLEDVYIFCYAECAHALVFGLYPTNVIFLGSRLVNNRGRVYSK